jgi:hypothetical protein
MIARTGRTFALAALATLLSAPMHAPGAQIVHGRVFDHADGRRIPHVTLELIDDRGDVLARTTADSLGEFRIRSWRAGKYTLKTTSIGYQPVTSQVLELATGDLVELNVHLAADAIPLEPITIIARARASLAELAMSGYYDRRDSGRRLGLGRFFDRGAIERRGRRLTDILATIPGVKVMQVPNCPVPLISMAGNNFTRFEERTTGELERNITTSEACNPASICRANIYVDGVQMHFDEAISIDQAVPMDWIEGIEVYRRASEVPAEYLSRATCGVVAVWTRRG